MDNRWKLYAYRELVWKSELCTDHKFVLIALTSFMHNGRHLAYPGRRQLVTYTSMSLTKVGRSLQELVKGDWLERDWPPDAELPAPGRRPNCYYLPMQGTVPEVLEHCLLSRSRNRSGLRRGRPPNG